MRSKYYALAAILVLGVSILVSVSASATDETELLPEEELLQEVLTEGEGETENPTPTPEVMPDPTPSPSPTPQIEVEITESFDDELSALTAINVKVGRILVQQQYLFYFLALIAGIVLAGFILLIVFKWWGGAL